MFKKILFTILAVGIAFCVYAEDEIPNFEEDSVPIINNEFRLVRDDVDDLEAVDTATGTRLDTLEAEPHVVVQIVYAQSGEVVAITGNIPSDDTKPRNTEGTEVMTLAITPTSATNRLRFEMVMCVACTTSEDRTTLALFQDSTVDAIAAVQAVPNITAVEAIPFPHNMVAGTISSTTFKVRIGSVTNNATLNGEAGTRKLGGIMASNMTITEYEV